LVNSPSGRNEKGEIIRQINTNCLREEINIPALEGLKPVIQIKKRILKEIILSTKFACSDDDDRGVLFGIHLEKKGDILFCVATDGTILVEKKIPLSQIDLFELESLNLSVDIIDHLLFSMEDKEEELVTFSVTEDPKMTEYIFSRKTGKPIKTEDSLTRPDEERFMVIQTDNIQIIFVDHHSIKYPDYQFIADREKKEVATVSAFELEKALIKLGKDQDWRNPFLFFLQGKEGNLLAIDDTALGDPENIVEIKGLEDSLTQDDWKIYLRKESLDSFLFSLKEDQEIKISLTQEVNGTSRLFFMEGKDSLFGTTQCITGDQK
jgi:hypothetical protein